MIKISFHCQTLTPMFLAGADNRTPELRPQSVKGAMRFWWRAVHPHLVTKSGLSWDYKALSAAESELMGGTGDKEGRSKFSIRLRPVQTKVDKAFPVPHKKNMTKKAYTEGSTFIIDLGFKPDHAGHAANASALLMLALALGGLGNRARRGMGSVQVTRVEDNLNDLGLNRLDLKYPGTLADIMELVKKVTDGRAPYFVQSSGLQYTGLAFPDYPFIRSVEVGTPKKNMLFATSQATHDLKETYGSRYEATMGTAARDRFASPLYVSALAGMKPVVTTLHEAPPENLKRFFTQNIQDEFKEKVL